VTPSGSDVSGAFNIIGGAGGELVWTAQPAASTVEGAVIGGSPTVEIRDNTGTVVSVNTPVTVTLGANPGSGVLGGTLTVMSVNGVATFSTLTIDKAGAGYSLSASAAGGYDLGVTAPGFTITAAPVVPVASQVTWTNSPTGSYAQNTNILNAGSLAVTVQDSGGGTITTGGVPITVVFGANPAGGTLSGTLTQTTLPSGIATFGDLQVNNAGSNYTLLAFSGGLTHDVSGTFNITGPAATRLRITDHPVAVQEANNLETRGAGVGTAQAYDLSANDIVAGTGILPGSVRIVVNLFGGGTETISDYADPATPGSGILVGTNGVLPGGGTINYGSGAMVGTTAAVLDGLGAGPFTFQVDETHETTGTGAAATGFSVRVEALTAAGDLDTAFVGNITVALATNPGSSTLGGTLVLPAGGGVATFANLTVNNAGTGYTLAATSPGLSDALSGGFNMTVAAGTGLTLSMLQEPQATVLPLSGANNFNQGETIDSQAAGSGGGFASITVRVLDGAGNPVNGVPVYLSIGANPAGGTLSGTLVALTTGAGPLGVATFSGISIDKVGAGYGLAFTANGVTGTTSQLFTVQSSRATTIQFRPAAPGPLGQPSNVVTNTAFAPTVAVEVLDGLGRPVTTSTGVTLIVGNNPGGAILGGNSTVVTASGTATFGSVTLSQPGTGYTLWALTSGLVPVESNAFNVTSPAGGGSRTLSFTAAGAVQPATGAPGALASVIVALLDATGAIELGSGDLITLDLGVNPGGAVLGGTRTATVNPATGLATFAGLTMSQLGTGYTIVAYSGGITPTESTAFNVALAFTAANVTGLNAGSSIRHIVAFDRDGDTDLDLMILDEDGGVGNQGQIFDLRNTGGIFSQPGATINLPAGTVNPQHLAVGDIDGAGNPDFVISDSNAASPHRVYDGTNTLIASPLKATGARTAQIGTFFNSATLKGPNTLHGSVPAATMDLATGLTTSLVGGIVPGTLSITVTDAAGPLGQTITDNGLGFLIGTSNGGNPILPNGAGTYTIDYTTGAMTGVTAALQGTSTVIETHTATAGLDIVSDSNATANLGTYDGTGGGRFFPETASGTTANVFALAAGDFSPAVPDGNTDLLIATDTAEVIFVTQSVLGTFDAETSLTGPAGKRSRYVELVDIDGDGDLDGLVGYQNLGGGTDFYACINTAGVLANPTLLVSAASSSPPENTRAAVGDVTGDGIPDLVTPSDAGVTIYAGQSGLVFTKVLTLVDRQNVRSVVVGTFDAGGNLDIAATGGGGVGTNVATVWLR
ncbi:MAG: hypothetical protein JKY65_34220, partial [Planctomycetes bacterium]|nr:hypothetical protein [Planctomycetota bacterium]